MAREVGHQGRGQPLLLYPQDGPPGRSRSLRSSIGKCCAGLTPPAIPMRASPSSPGLLVIPTAIRYTLRMKRQRLFLLSLLFTIFMAACSPGHLGGNEIAFVRDGHLWTIDPNGAHL